MHLVQRFLTLICLLLAGGLVSGEEVEITVFTLKDGRKIETISHASGVKEGQEIYIVTTTKGEKVSLWGPEVTGKENVKKDLSELPEYAREVITAQQKLHESWAERRAAEQKAEEEKRKTALVRAAELAEVGKAVREAELEERTIRARCANLQDEINRSKGQVREAQEDIKRERSNRDRQLRNDRNRQNDRNRRDRDRDRYSDNRIKEAEKRLENANKQIKQSEGELNKAKSELSEAEQKVANAKKQYQEALKRYKVPAPKPEPVPAETERAFQAAQEAAKKANPQPPEGPKARSNVAENVETGKFIKLADGSFWQVRPEDHIASRHWEREQEIVVYNCADPVYSYRLVNDTTKMAVHAKKME